MATQSPALKGLVKGYQKRLVNDGSASYLAVVTSVAEGCTGPTCTALSSTSCMCTRARTSSRFWRRAPAPAAALIVMITTADDGRKDTVYARRRDFVEQLGA